jgi:hypothetical protein
MVVGVPDHRQRTFLYLLEKKAGLMREDAAKKFVEVSVRQFKECNMDPQDAVYKHFESDVESLAARQDISQADKESAVIGSFSVLVDPAYIGMGLDLYDPQKLDILAGVIREEADLYKTIGFDLSSKLGASRDFKKNLSDYLDRNVEGCAIVIRTYLRGVLGQLPGIG